MATLTQAERPKVDHIEAVAAAARCVAVLMSRFGATRVIPFGSVLAPAVWHEDSDLDLAVEGIDPAQFFAAWRALRQVVPSDQLMEAVRTYATKLAKGPRVAMELAKRLVYEGLETNNLFKELRSAEHAMVIARTTEDAIEGPRAWAEKRPPQFKGR